MYPSGTGTISFLKSHFKRFIVGTMSSFIQVVWILPLNPQNFRLLIFIYLLTVIIPTSSKFYGSLGERDVYGNERRRMMNAPLLSTGTKRSSFVKSFDEPQKI